MNIRALISRFLIIKFSNLLKLYTVNIQKHEYQSNYIFFIFQLQYCDINGKKYIEPRIIGLLEFEDKATILDKLQGVNLENVIDDVGSTLLHEAVNLGSPKSIDFLIKSGCKIDAQNSHGLTPLMLAVSNAKEKHVELLLKANADTHKIRDISGKNSLQMAIHSNRGTSTIMKMFFDKMKKYGLPDEKLLDILLAAGCSLDRVIYLNNSKLTKIMLERNYCVNARNANGETALHVAASLNDLKNVMVLLEYKANVNVMNFNEQVPFIYHVIHRKVQNLKIMDKILTNNVNWTEFDRGNREQLKLYPIFANGTEDTMKLFIKTYSIDFTTRDQLGRTALHYLAFNNNRKALKPLRYIKFDMDASDITGETALHVAAKQEASYVLQFLLDRKANVNVLDNHGCSPLFHAIHKKGKSSRRMWCVNLLMQYHADAQIINDSNQTVIQMCIDLKNYNLAEPILAHLAIIDEFGGFIKENIRQQIDSVKRLRDYYKSCTRQLAKMKEDIIFENFTMFDFLAERQEEKIYRYVRKAEVVEKFRRNTFNSNSYYCNLLRYRYDKAVKTNKLRRKAALLISDVVGLFDCDHIVMQKIIEFLDFYDLKKFR